MPEPKSAPQSQHTIAPKATTKIPLELVYHVRAGAPDVPVTELAISVAPTLSGPKICITAKCSVTHCVKTATMAASLATQPKETTIALPVVTSTTSMVSSSSV